MQYTANNPDTQKGIEATSSASAGGQNSLNTESSENINNPASNISFERAKGRYKDLLQKLLREKIASAFTGRDAAAFADEILQIANSDPELNQTRNLSMEKLCDKFGIKVYKSADLKQKVSGKIFAYGTTKDVYKHDVVIISNSNEQFEHRRFVIAHELGHYLFDCIGNPQYQGESKVFCETYIHSADSHEELKERRADRFAAELLLPIARVKENYIAIAKSSDGQIFGRDYVVNQLAQYFQVKVTTIERRLKEILEDGGY